MSSPSTQFATSTRMGIYEPFHQISMWEDTFKVDITPNAGLSTVVQIDSNLDNNLKMIESGYTSHESLGPSGNNQEANHTSEKIKRRLAQNREAARKSRLRKKAYVQQLETSRLKLAQMEQELQRARQQGLYIGGHTGINSVANTGIAAFEMEYGLWMDELQRKNFELRNVLQAHISDIELQIFVESGFNHYYELFRMKADAAKADVFYLISGTWRTSVERFFLWIGGFRPSELLNVMIMAFFDGVFPDSGLRQKVQIDTNYRERSDTKCKLRGCKVIMPQLEPLTDQQLLNFGTLRQSSQQAEDALSLGMEKLQQTVVQNITTDPTCALGYNSQMASAVENLEALETFVSQADHLRQQTLQQMSRVLTTRQAARGLLALGEYFQRLRALSSLWAARPHEGT